MAGPRFEGNSCGPRFEGEGNSGGPRFEGNSDSWT